MKYLNRLLILLSAALLLSAISACTTEVASSAKTDHPEWRQPLSASEQLVVLDVPADQADSVMSALESQTRTAAPSAGDGPNSAFGFGHAETRSTEARRPMVESARREVTGREEVETATMLRGAYQRAASSAQSITAARQGELWARPVVRADGEVSDAIPFPLKHTAVRAAISGHVSHTAVTQNYENPFETPIEAVYVFPLPENSAVNGFVMTVGERVIIGRIMRRAEARETYENARRQGWTASLLEQERPNIFTQSVANIAPKQEVQVEISYASVLKRERGEYTWNFPMVVGPRYPGNTPDFNRIEPGAIVPEGMRNGHDISVEVAIDAGMPVQNIRVPTHNTETVRHDGHRVTVRLADGDRIPNRDFVLRFDVLGEGLQTGLVTNAKDGKGHLSIMFTPPANPGEQDVSPREITFVLDISGSMNGVPMDLSKRLMNQMLGSLRPHDTFNIFYFASGNGQLWETPRANTPENVAAARDYMSRLRAGGGTEMLAGLQRLFNSPRANNALRMVVFLTDGYVGNEQAIIRAVKANSEGSRFFMFGIGSSINHYLIDGIGRHGRGHSVTIYPREHKHHEQIVADFFSRVDAPCLTDIVVDWGDLPVTEQYPSLVPDVFAGHPVTLAAAYDASKGPLTGNVTIRGRRNGAPIEYTIAVNLPADDQSNPGIAAVWARAKIDDISELRLSARGNDHALLTEQLIAVALEHGLMSEGTSFVAVDQSQSVGDGKPTRIDVPVEQPEDVDRSTTRPGSGARAGGE
jgi:Ca-activated chloride channel family protein